MPYCWGDRHPSKTCRSNCMTRRKTAKMRVAVYRTGELERPGPPPGLQEMKSPTLGGHGKTGLAQRESPGGALPVISPPSTVTPHLHLLFCPLPLVSPCLPCFISSSRGQPDVCIWCCSSCGWHPAQQPRRCGWPPGTQGGSWRSPWQVGPDVKVGGVVPG